MDDLKSSVDELYKRWNHPQLLRIWGIISFANYRDGEPFLNAEDINEIAEAVKLLNLDWPGKPGS